MTVQRKFVVSAVLLLGLSACGAAQDDAGSTITAATLTVATTTASSASSTTTAPAPAFAATPDEFEARMEIFGTAVGDEIGTFAPIQNSQVVGASAGEHVVGYFLGENEQLLATALYVAIPEGQTSFSTPAQLLSVVATTPVDSDDIDAAIEVFKREVLDDLSTIDSPIKTYEGGPPYFVLTAAAEPTGVLFVAQPPGSPAPPIAEIRQRLSTLVK